MKALKEFTVRREKKEGVEIIRLIGPLDESRYPRLQGVLQSLLQTGHNKIIMDCYDLDFMSSAAIQALAQFVKQTREAKGEMILVRIPSNVQEIIHLLGCSEEFKTCEKEKDAMQQLAADAPKDLPNSH
jgi:anti-sigma B factor antagonist